MRVWAPAVAGLVAAAGISGYLLLRGDPAYRVATFTTSPSRFGFQAALSGHLEGLVNPDGTACFWMSSEQGRMYLIWPGGYSARAKPTRILDDHGHAIAIVGDDSNLGGGLVPDESMSKPILGCPTHHLAWLVAPD